MLVFGLLAAWRNRGTRVAMAMAAASLCSFLVWLLPDPFLDLPEGYRSHLVFVLVGGGSAHGDVLSGNGANLWALVSSDPSASSLETVYAGLTAKAWGLILFGGYQLLLLVWIVLEARRREPEAQVRDAMGFGIVYIGACNLAMATLLTGVHERYLFHGVPFLILGMSLRVQRGIRFSQWLSPAVWFVAGWSGLFVLSSIHWDAFSGLLSPFRSHTVAGVLELMLLAALGVQLVLCRYRWEDKLAD
jgi:hypothetical protein